MLFLLEYDRRKGKLVTIKSFKDDDRTKAEKQRLDVEMRLQKKRLNHEVVLLEATNKSALRRTHQRFFKNASQLIAEKNIYQESSIS